VPRPSLLPTPINEYTDEGDCIVHELIRGGGSGGQDIIRKDSEEYRKAVEKTTTRTEQ
jgi:hypothetical protein